MTKLAFTCFVCAFLAAPAFAQIASPYIAPSADSTAAKDQDTRYAWLVKKADDAAEARRSRTKSGAPDSADFNEAKYRILAALVDRKSTAVPIEVMAMADQAKKGAGLSRREAFELTRLAAAANSKGRKYPGVAAWREAKEREAIDLWRSFPDLPDAAAALLARAAWAEPKRMAELAATVEDSAPDGATKARAQLLRRRAALEGANLFAALSEAKGGLVLAKECVGRPVVFYTWSPGDEAALTELAKILRRAPSNVRLIGIAVGASSSRGPRSAKPAVSLPGRQLYGSRGETSPLALRLTLTEPGLMLASDSAGKMRLLRTESSPATILANLR